jgi:DNA-binding response OmpR family regulator
MLTRNGINKKLSKTDTNFIAYLCANKGKDIKRSDCVNAIWGENTYKNLRIMDVYIHRIRKNLKDDTSIYLINLHGKGYRFIF